MAPRDAMITTHHNLVKLEASKQTRSSVHSVRRSAVELRASGIWSQDDGRKADSASRQERHRCQVRWVDDADSLSGWLVSFRHSKGSFHVDVHVFPHFYSRRVFAL